MFRKDSATFRRRSRSRKRRSILRNITRVNDIAGATWDLFRSPCPSLIVRLTRLFRFNPLSLHRSVPPFSPFRSSCFSFPLSVARALDLPFSARDRTQSFSLSLSLSVFLPFRHLARACVWVRGSAIELVNGLAAVRCFASAARSIVLSQCVPYAGTVKYSS